MDENNHERCTDENGLMSQYVAKQVFPGFFYQLYFYHDKLSHVHYL